MAVSGPGKITNPGKLFREPVAGFDERFDELLEKIKDPEKYPSIKFLDFSEVGDLLTKEKLKKLSDAIYARASVLRINLKGAKLTAEDLAQFSIGVNRNLYAFEWDMPEIPGREVLQKYWASINKLSNEYISTLRVHGLPKKETTSAIAEANKQFKREFGRLTLDKMRKKIADTKAKRIVSRDQTKHVQHQALLHLLNEVEEIIKDPGGFEALQYYFNNKEEADIIFGFKAKTDDLKEKEEKHRAELARESELKVASEMSKRTASPEVQRYLEEHWGYVEEEDAIELTKEKTKVNRSLSDVSSEMQGMEEVESDLQNKDIQNKFQLANGKLILESLFGDKEQKSFFDLLEGLTPDQASNLKRAGAARAIELLPDDKAIEFLPDDKIMQYKKIQVIKFIAHLTPDQADKFEASQFFQLLVWGPDAVRNKAISVAESLSGNGTASSAFDRIENGLMGVRADDKARLEALTRLESVALEARAAVLEARAAQKFQSRQSQIARTKLVEPKGRFVYDKEKDKDDKAMDETVSRSKEHTLSALKYVDQNIVHSMNLLKEKHKKLPRSQFIQRAAISNDLKYLEEAEKILNSMRAKLEDISNQGKLRKEECLQHLQDALEVLDQTRSKVQDKSLLAALGANLKQLNIVINGIQEPKGKNRPDSP